MKFLHTSDWQIGMKAAHVGKAAEKVRIARLDTIRRIQQVARDEAVDFVLIAGDTFEDHGVSRKLVSQVGDILAGIDCPTYLIPGNHDPWIPGGVWDHARERWSKRIHILLEAKPVEIPGGRLYPCPLTERWSNDDPTLWIPTESGEGIRIGLAHGSLDGPLWEGQKHHPIPPDSPTKHQLDYLALGDWHSVKQIKGQGGGVRMAYCGTPEPTKFGETESGHVLLVEIGSRGAPPRIEKFKVGELDWWNLESESRQEGDLTRLIKTVKQHPNPEKTLVKLRLSGLLFAKEVDFVRDLAELVISDRFVYGEMDDRDLLPAPSDDAWINDLPDGLIRHAAEKLLKKAESDKDLVARRALIDLYRLNGGAE